MSQTTQSRVAHYKSYSESILAVGYNGSVRMGLSGIDTSKGLAVHPMGYPNTGSVINTELIGQNFKIHEFM